MSLSVYLKTLTRVKVFFPSPQHFYFQKGIHNYSIQPPIPLIIIYILLKYALLQCWSFMAESIYYRNFYSGGNSIKENIEARVLLLKVYITSCILLITDFDTSNLLRGNKTIRYFKLVHQFILLAFFMYYLYLFLFIFLFAII